MRILLVFIVILSLSSCGYREKRNAEVLDSWIGSTEQEIVSAWGRPDSDYDSGNMRYLTWSDTSLCEGCGGWKDAEGNYNDTLNNCKYTFIFESGRVVSWEYRGCIF